MVELDSCMHTANVWGPVRDVWRGRDLTFALAWRDVRIRYAQSSLAILWALLTPALTVLAGFAIDAAARARGVTSDGRLSAVILTSVPWAFVTACLSSATTCVHSNGALVGKIAFPRVTLPLAAIVAQVPDALVAGCAVTAWLILTHSAAAISLVSIIVCLLILLVWTVAFCVLLSALGALFRDVKYIVQVVLRFSVFTVPVLYTPDELGPRLGSLLALNPFSVPLLGLRLAVFRNHDLRFRLGSAGVELWVPSDLMWSALAAVFGLVCAFWFFSRAEPLLADAA